MTTYQKPFSEFTVSLVAVPPQLGRTGETFFVSHGLQSDLTDDDAYLVHLLELSSSSHSTGHLWVSQIITTAQ